MLSDFSKSTVKLRTSNENSKKKKKKNWAKSSARVVFDSKLFVMEMRFQINGKFKCFDSFIYQKAYLLCANYYNICNELKSCCLYKYN